MKVKFVPQNVEYEIRLGQTVLDLAHEKGITIHSTCNGMPSCAECRIKVVEGEYNLLPPSKKELSLIGTGYYIDQRRLACQMLCFGDVTIDTTEHLEKENEGPITKKFLSKVHKTSAEESHSVGGILIEQEESVLKELSSDANVGVAKPSGDQKEFMNIEEGASGGRPSRRAHHRDRDRDRNRGSAQGQNPNRSGNGGDQGSGKSRRRRRRGGRNKSAPR